MTKAEEMQLVLDTVIGAGYTVYVEQVDCVADDLPMPAFMPDNYYLVKYTQCGDWKLLNTPKTNWFVHGKTTTEGIDFVIVEVIR